MLFRTCGKAEIVFEEKHQRTVPYAPRKKTPLALKTGWDTLYTPNLHTNNASAIVTQALYPLANEDDGTLASGEIGRKVDEQLRRLMAVRALLWLLVLCSCSLSDARKHRYGSHYKKVAKTRYIQPAMPPDSVVIDGFVYERQRKQVRLTTANDVP